MQKKTPKFDIEKFFQTLADRTRLRLLNLMSLDEICVCFFVAVIGTNQPKISRHLAYLRRTGIVRARREGKWVHYSLAEPEDANSRHLLDEVLTWLKNDPEMQRDRERLTKVCCAPRPPVVIQGAPRPARLVTRSEKTLPS